MKLKLSVSILISSLLLIGCGSTPQPSKEISNSKKTITPKPIIKNTTPNWILNPNKQNQICSIGSANITKIDETKKIAFIKAKSNISKEIKLHINSQTSKQLNCNNSECKKEFNKFSQQQSTNMLNNISLSDEYVDTKNNRYYVRACSAKSNEKFTYSKPTTRTIKNRYKTTKTSCIQQSNYPNKTLDQQKKILIENAKFEALGELYGHLLVSSTDIKNGKIIDDTIKQRAVGNVRIEGNPSFYNGSNLGEICSDITAYITQKDLEQFKPKKVELNRFCYNNPTTPQNKIKEKANFQAYKKAISQYKPSLKNISDKQSAKLIHGFIKSNEKFDFDTGVYCFDAVATLLPYELELSKVNKMKMEEEKENLISGLTAIFYTKNDHAMTKPLYKTYIDTLDLGYRRLPFNSKIKKNKIYNIKITGFIKSENNAKTNLKMFSDVYSASLFINNKKVMTHKQKNKTISLKKGLNKIKLLVKTANSYDIKVLGDINDIYTNKIQ
ncbi:MAG: LPP20 family lipoprotein [Campylobacterota bacterium]|nr:LPP20 family lipoprotein [Campylobacterota bacterium]